jgi:hypothetical protein
VRTRGIDAWLMGHGKRHHGFHAERRQLINAAQGQKITRSCSCSLCPPLATSNVMQRAGPLRCYDSTLKPNLTQNSIHTASTIASLRAGCTKNSQQIYVNGRVCEPELAAPEKAHTHS